MEDRTRTIIIGAVVLLILAAVFGTVFYLGRTAKNQGSTPTGVPQISRTPAISVSPTPTGGVAALPGTKTLAAVGFVLHYPSSWGILTCNNSQNVEFDPINGTDSKSVVCDVAVKPVTVLVSQNRLSCTGETVKLGNYQVQRSKNTAASGDINYRWCYSVGGKNLDITHRVSSSGARATSKEDFSAQVEQIISTSQVTPQGS